MTPSSDDNSTEDFKHDSEKEYGYIFSVLKSADSRTKLIALKTILGETVDVKFILFLKANIHLVKGFLRFIELQGVDDTERCLTFLSLKILINISSIPEVCSHLVQDLNAMERILEICFRPKDNKRGGSALEEQRNEGIDMPSVFKVLLNLTREKIASEKFIYAHMMKERNNSGIDEGNEEKPERLLIDNFPLVKKMFIIYFSNIEREIDPMGFILWNLISHSEEIREAICQIVDGGTPFLGCLTVSLSLAKKSNNSEDAMIDDEVNKSLLRRRKVVLAMIQNLCVDSTNHSAILLSGCMSRSLCFCIPTFHYLSKQSDELVTDKHSAEVSLDPKKDTITEIHDDVSRGYIDPYIEEHAGDIYFTRDESSRSLVAESLISLSETNEALDYFRKNGYQYLIDRWLGSETNSEINDNLGVVLSRLKNEREDLNSFMETMGDGIFVMGD